MQDLQSEPACYYHSHAHRVTRIPIYRKLLRNEIQRRSPQLLLSLRVLVQMGTRMVPHLVVPPVHWKMQLPWLQMVMAEGSVGQTVPHEPLKQ